MVASQWEQLLGNNAKYLELEQNAISNPLYCADNGNDLPNIETNIDEDNLDHLWYPPNRNSLDTIEQEMNNFNVVNKESARLLQSGNFEGNQIGYDVPRPLIETKTTEQRLRYENEVIPIPSISTSTPKSNSYINEAMDKSKFFLWKSDGEASSGYESPINRAKSYLDMTNQEIESNTPPPPPPEMPKTSGEVYYKQVNKKNKNISNNLDTKNVDKKLSKDLSFKFMSLLNLSDDPQAII